NRDYFTHLTINNQYLNYCDSLTAFTSVTGLIGHPVVTMPIGLDTNGLPIGLQLVGKMNGEQELLKIARQLSASINFPNCPIF
ncbi:MAG: amidase, partial [Oceanospirillaceae bacterium]